MTVEPFPEVLHSWRHRFRYPDLVVALADPAASPEDLAHALADGLGTDEDPVDVARTLIREQHLAAARLLLDEADIGRAADGLAEELAQAEEAARRAVRDRIDLVRTRAGDRGIDITIDEADLTARASDEPVTVMAELDRHDEIVEAANEQMAATLRQQAEAIARTLHETVAKVWLREVSALIDDGRLRIAARALEDDVARDVGPWVIPFPKVEALVGEGDRALDMIVEGTGTPAFRQAFGNEEARQLAAAYQGLDGTVASAQDLADVLVRMLGAEPTRVSADDDGIGHVFPLHMLRSLDLARKLQLVDVTMWIGGPGAVEVPEGVGGRVIAVGPDLVAREGRHRVAVVDITDLLRVVMVPFRREIALVRAAARRWPVETLLPADDRDLERTLGPTLAERRSLVDWVVDLSGLGSMADAAAVVDATGTLPRLVRLALLAPQGPAVASATTGDDTAVLAGLPAGPEEVAALWAVLWVGDLDRWTPRAEVLDYVDAEFGVAPTVLERIDRGIDTLGAHHVLEVRGPDYRLQRWGWVESLLTRAPQRLPRHLATLGEMSERAEQEFLSKLAGIVTQLTIHERRSMARYRAKARAAGIEGVGDADLEDPPDPESLLKPGGFEPIAVLVDLCRELHLMAPGHAIELEGDECPELEMSEAMLRTVFKELVINAIEVSPQGGRVLITVDDAHERDVVFSVKDSGPGVDPGDAMKIFRSGESLRIPRSTGHGLSLLRQHLLGIDGDLHLVRPRGDGLYSGATFQLAIPRLSAR
jgi:signal transduction histidine kinase